MATGRGGALGFAVSENQAAFLDREAAAAIDNRDRQTTVRPLLRTASAEPAMSQGRAYPIPTETDIRRNVYE
ncbi:hypothetical protein [Mesorhizobium silamurunense]|uniref:hypothetical protein n=1 Tax=Mesorhizobium silamurunense TaxID=499528 RepID=UPI0017802F3E|nr:hypothetical protein [Mesorhizobium silamurunense]